MISPALTVSSFSFWPAKSYKTLACIFAFAGGAAGGGGGGTRTAEDAEFWFRVWLGILLVAATGVGTGREDAWRAAGPRFAVEDPVDRAFVFRIGRPPGPPGLISLPRVIGLGGTGLPLGVGLDPDDGDSPGCVCTAPLL